MSLNRYTSTAKLFFKAVLLATIAIIFIFTSSISYRPLAESEPAYNSMKTDEDVFFITDVDFQSTLSNDIDLADLASQNTDTLGYMQIPDTNIDYPIMRGVDNLKYLTTNFEGEYDPFGALFSDMINSDSLLDPITVVYGHYISGMAPERAVFFTELHNYRTEGYLEDHKYIYMYTPSGNYIYEVVATVINDNYNVLYNIDLENNSYSVRDQTNEADIQNFIDHIAALPDETAYRNLEDASADDSFLVLSTCMMAGESSDNRYMVIGKQLNEESYGVTKAFLNSVS